MNEDFDLKIRRIEEREHVYQGTKLILTMEGTDATHYLMNTLRHVIYREIPTYAFYKSEINISKNTSVFDNNYMYIRLSMIPIPGVKCLIDFLEPTYYPYVAGATDTIKPEHPSKYQRSKEDDTDIYFYLNVKNDSNEIKNVMMSDGKIIINGKEVKNVYDEKNPSLVVKLKKGQEFVVSMRAIIGIQKLNDCWACASQVYFGKMDINKYVFVLKSLGQRTEWEILIVSCDILITKLMKFKENLMEKFSDNKQISALTSIIIMIERESHMMGNLLASTLYKHPKILFSGYKIDHPLEPEVTLELVSQQGYSVTKALFEGIDNIIAMFKYIKNEFKKAEKVKFVQNKRLEEIKRVIGPEHQIHASTAKINKSKSSGRG